jgi:hypothetical protein
MIKTLYLSLLLIVACSSKKLPSEVIEPEQMKLIVWDILRADELVMNQLNADTTKTTKQKLAESYANVFSLHKISSTDFYKSYDYYQAHPLLHRDLMDSVYAYGTRERSKQDKIRVPTKLLKPGVDK